MGAKTWSFRLQTGLVLLCILVGQAAPAAAQELVVDKIGLQTAAPASVRLTLEEIKARVLANNKLLQLAAHNIQSKGYAVRAVKANYFPQVIGSSVYFHFNDNLGDVVTLGGRSFHGILGRPITIPTASVALPLIDQNSSFTTIAAVQPITDLLKVRAGVNLARADERIAEAQMEKGRRELVSGVEQLFWGILAAQRIRGGAEAAAAGAGQLAQTGNLEARMALIEAKQGLQEVGSQLVELEGQLATLLDLPTSTKIELVEPPLPSAPVKTAEEAAGLALANSPELQEADQTICKARAAVAAAKVDFYPNIAVVGGYANNNMMDVIQPNFGYVGVIGTYTFLDWGKRRNTLNERNQLIAMATLKAQQTHDDVQLKAVKAFQDYESTRAALELAGQLAAVRQEAVEKATTLPAKFATSKDLAKAQVDAVKADLAHRFAYVKLMSVLGRH